MTALRWPLSDVHAQMSTCRWPHAPPPRLSSFYTICEMFVILL